MSPCDNLRDSLQNHSLKDILRVQPRAPIDVSNRLVISDKRLQESSNKSRMQHKVRKEHFSTHNLLARESYEGLLERPKHDETEILTQSALKRVRLNSGLAYESGSYRNNSQTS